MRGVATIIAVGTKFERLTVTGPAYRETRQRKSGPYTLACYPCLCTCGTTKGVPAAELIGGRTRSCGCLHAEGVKVYCRTHGGARSRLYRILRNMINRCEKPANEHDFKHYGGRGITVCEEWRRDFAAFRDWALANGYEPDLTIERKDVDGDYEPDNCTFVTRKQQSLNKRNTRRAEYLGETKTWLEWSLDPRCAVNPGSFIDRMKKGWSIEDSFTLPRQKTGPKPRSIAAGTDKEGFTLP